MFSNFNAMRNKGYTNFSYVKTVGQHLYETIFAMVNTDGGVITMGDPKKMIPKLYSNPQTEIDRIKAGLPDINDNSLIEVISQDIEREGRFAGIVQIYVSVASRKVIYNDKYYFRHGNKNYGLTVDKYLSKRYGIGERKRSKDGHEIIGPFFKKEYFYKYMSLELVLSCLQSKQVWFAQPSLWDDKYESRFYCAEIVPRNDDANPVVYAYCVTGKCDNEAAWKIYSHNKTGLASRCVKLKLNKCKFRQELSRTIRNIDSDARLFEGTVQYKNEYFISDLHKKEFKRLNGNTEQNEPYSAYFKSFSLDKYLNLLLLKRDAFLHEQEIRFFIIPAKVGNKGKYVHSEGKGRDNAFYKIDDFRWADVIEGVYYDKKCSDMEIKLLKHELEKNNIKIKNDISDEKGVFFEGYDVYSGRERDSKPLMIEVEM